MSSLEKKLTALKKCKNMLEPSGNRTQEVRTCISKIETAFQDYIKSDNVSLSDAVTGPLSITVEEHEDFKSAVSHINSAIRATQAEIEAEERARQAAMQANQKG
jgi:hypothetical protein